MISQTGTDKQLNGTHNMLLTRLIDFPLLAYQLHFACLICMGINYNRTTNKILLLMQLQLQFLNIFIHRYITMHNLEGLINFKSNLSNIYVNVYTVYIYIPKTTGYTVDMELLRTKSTTQLYVVA